MIDVYKTTDIILAACLKINGYVLDSIKKVPSGSGDSTKGIFVFKNIPKEFVSDYDLGKILVEPDPLDQQLYDTVFQKVAAGIATTGNQSGTSTDSQGIPHAVNYSRPTEIPIYVIVNVIVDATKFPADGAAQIQAAITTWAGSLASGRDAVASAISAQAFHVAGVLDVSSCLIGTAPSPATSTTVAISLRQLATFDTSRISINVTPGTP